MGTREPNASCIGTSFRRTPEPIPRVYRSETSYGYGSGSEAGTTGVNDGTDYSAAFAAAGEPTSRDSHDESVAGIKPTKP
jgi:hypothetical protein